MDKRSNFHFIKFLVHLFLSIDSSGVDVDIMCKQQLMHFHLGCSGGLVHFNYRGQVRWLRLELAELLIGGEAVELERKWELEAATAKSIDPTIESSHVGK